MHGMDWDGLQVFLAVARTGRISAAARRLGVEHTTVSRRLAALERALGVPLFYRTASGYLPTTHGQNALAQAEVMERAALAVAARAREDGDAAAGCVRVAMAPEFASHWLAPALPSFRAAHPQVRLQVLVGTKQRDLWRGEAELAVQAPRPRQQGVVAVRIAHVTLGLYASREIAEARWKVTGRETLRGRPLLTYTPAFAMLQDARWFQALRGEAEIAVESNSTHALLAAARAGAGVAVLPRFVARRHDDLVSVSEDVAGHDVWLVAHPESRRDPAVRAAGEFLKQRAASPGGLG
jgi:DNA-binding transcriptional LysR family regulator